jgi:hypothetical protein
MAASLPDFTAKATTQTLLYIEEKHCGAGRKILGQEY